MKLNNQYWEFGRIQIILGTAFVCLATFFFVRDRGISDFKSAIVILFLALVGLHLSVHGFMQIFRRRKFRSAHLEIPEAIVSLGSDFSGALIIPNSELRTLARSPFSFTISNLHERVTGSGKNRSKWIDVLWQEKAIIEAQSDGRGLRIPFSFQLPGDAAETNIENSRSKYLWKIEIHAPLPGLDYFGDFIFEAKKTAKTNLNLKAQTMPGPIEMARNLKPIELKDTVVEGSSGNKTMRFKTLRAPSVNGAFLFMGLLFMGIAGVMLYAVIKSSSSFSYGMVPFILVFGGIGFLLEVLMIYITFTKRTLQIKPNGILISKSLLGMRFEKEVSWADVQDIEIKNTTRQGTRVWHDVKIKIRNGPSKTIASQIENKVEAEWIRLQITEANPLKAA